MSSTNGSGKPPLMPLPPELNPLHRKHKDSGQRVSNERGAHTRCKKNPGKRAHQGGS
ncbi:MAG: hypothetical protein ACXWKQ_06565 [Reyranella sp.]